MIHFENWRVARNAVWELEGSLSFKERNTLRSNLGFIYKRRPHEGGGGLANAGACVNFACKLTNFADVGERGKNGKILRTSFMDGP